MGLWLNPGRALNTWEAKQLFSLNQFMQRPDFLLTPDLT